MMGFATKRKGVAIGVIGLGGLFVAVFAAQTFLMNSWLLLTEYAYFIPAESSMWRFEATVMNPGSGEWWLYGQDGKVLLCTRHWWIGEAWRLFANLGCRF